MPFDGIFLNKMLHEIKPLISGRISKINQISDYEFLFIVRANGTNKKLLISLHPENCRIQLTELDYETPPEPTNMTMFLRKYFDGGIITDIAQYQADRVLDIVVLATNDLGDRVFRKIIIEIMGRRSNMILCEETKILDSFRHNAPFENGRTIIPGACYTYPENDKLNIFTMTNEQIKDIMNKTDCVDMHKCFSGFSKTIQNELINYYSLETFITIRDDIKPTVFVTADEYYFIDLKSINGERMAYASLSNLLDKYYFERDKIIRIKQKSHDMHNYVKKQIERLKNKIEKLNNELQVALSCEEYRINGELILANVHTLSQSNEAIVLNYYTNEEIKIPLDPLLNPLENANRYFFRYQKAKKAINHLQTQLTETKDELGYFELLYVQIEKASINDALEIKEELEDYGYIRKKSKKRRKKHLTIATYNGINATIYVGKNNIQNDYLTNQFAKANDLWFHVKDAPGSHVLLVGEANENNIRLAANLAAINSMYADSSSVAIDYTKARYIKKIPRKRGCFVSYTNHKTIYIDPKK